MPSVSSAASVSARVQNSVRSAIRSSLVRSGSPSWTRTSSKSVTVSVVAVDGTNPSTAADGWRAGVVVRVLGRRGRQRRQRGRLGYRVVAAPGAHSSGVSAASTRRSMGGILPKPGPECRLPLAERRQQLLLRPADEVLLAFVADLHEGEVGETCLPPLAAPPRRSARRPGRTGSSSATSSGRTNWVAPANPFGPGSSALTFQPPANQRNCSCAGPHRVVAVRSPS